MNVWMGTQLDRYRITWRQTSGGQRGWERGVEGRLCILGQARRCHRLDLLLHLFPPAHPPARPSPKEASARPTVPQMGDPAALAGASSSSHAENHTRLM